MVNQAEEIVSHCRFTLHLPTNHQLSPAASRQCRLAADKVIRALSKDYRGSTYSTTLHSPFTGFWLDTAPQPHVPYKATVALLMIDVAISVNDEDAVQHHMDAIRKLAFTYYAQEGVPQLEIWLVVTPVLIKLYI